jgi:hypothetical protein
MSSDKKTLLSDWAAMTRSRRYRMICCRGSKLVEPTGPLRK